MNDRKPDRMTFLRQEYGAALLAAFKVDARNLPFWEWIFTPEHKPLAPEEAVAALFERYRGADPTPKGVFMQWLLRQAVRREIPAEDISKVRETLEAFERYKRRLPPEQRDIGRYEAVASVWKAIEPFVLQDTPASAKAEDRRAREQARAESTILLEKVGWTVAIPRTERAACWWGKGTRWCTAARNNNMFGRYAKDGPLIVFVRPDGAKFQFHAPSGQFMDAEDRMAKLPVLGGAMPLLDAHVPALRLTLELILDNFGTYATKAIGNIAPPLPDLPPPADMPPAPTEEPPRTSFRRRLASALKTVFVSAETHGSPAPPPPPVAVQDVVDPAMVALWGAAFAEFGLSLRWFRSLDMPDSLGVALCAHVAARNGALLSEFPRYLITERIALLAVQQHGMALQHVPLDRRSHEIVLAAVRQDGRALQFLPPSQRDRAMCLDAVHSNGLALEFVPREVVVREMCLIALRQTQAAIRFVPSYLADHEIYQMAASSPPDLLFSLLAS